MQHCDSRKSARMSPVLGRRLDSQGGGYYPPPEMFFSFFALLCTIRTKRNYAPGGALRYRLSDNGFLSRHIFLIFFEKYSVYSLELFF